MRCVCAYASWEFGAGTAELPTAGIQFRTTKMFLQRLFSFPFRNTSKVELQYWWAVRAADGAEDPGHAAASHWPVPRVPNAVECLIIYCLLFTYYSLLLPLIFFLLLRVGKSP